MRVRDEYAATAEAYPKARPMPDLTLSERLDKQRTLLERHQRYQVQQTERTIRELERQERRPRQM
ncbi:hypothetical protein [Streptomyces sp. NPDC096153]|uniref:hypothetical protein n=1 Tax=Streptomyces sp. NPDC096153 TaxID=3155548 RepID=UPI00332C53EC